MNRTRLGLTLIAVAVVVVGGLVGSASSSADSGPTPSTPTPDASGLPYGARCDDTGYELGFNIPIPFPEPPSSFKPTYDNEIIAVSRVVLNRSNTIGYVLTVGGGHQAFNPAAVLPGELPAIRSYLQFEDSTALVHDPRFDTMLLQGNGTDIFPISGKLPPKALSLEIQPCVSFPPGAKLPY